VYGGQVQPATREELFEAWEQWGREQTFINPVAVLTMCLQAALREQGFIVSSEPFKYFTVYRPLRFLQQTHRISVRLPEARAHFWLWVCWRLYEDGRACLSVEYGPDETTEEFSGVARNDSFDFDVRAKVPGIQPQTWAHHAHEARDLCFDLAQSERLLPGVDPVVSMLGIRTLVVNQLSELLAL
jgi:hypothetical protein